MTFNSASADIERIKRKASAEFSGRGWTIKRESTDDYDFEAILPNIRLFVKCVDKTAILYKDVSKMIASFEQINRELRRRFRQTRVIFLDYNFLGLDLDELVERKLIILTSDDVSEVSQIAEFQDNIPENLSLKQRAIMEQDCNFAIHTSTKYMLAKDQTNALIWAEIALKAQFGFSPAYTHFVTMATKFGKIERARVVAEEAFALRSDHRPTINDLISVAKAQGDIDTVSRLQARLQDERRAPTTLHDMLERQKRPLTNISKTSDSKVSQNTHGEMRKPIGRWLRGFFVREKDSAG